LTLDVINKQSSINNIIRPHINTIIQGHAVDVLRTLPEKSLDVCVTSPPYYGLRDYDTKPLTWEENDCDHEFDDYMTPLKPGQVEQTKYKNAIGSGAGQTKTLGRCCKKCRVWEGSLGNEPHFDMYITHLCDIFDEVHRVLKDDGTCWVNLGDTYSNSGGAGGDWVRGKKAKANKWKQPKIDYPRKSLLLIPFRFAIEMISRGWILRNTIIWHKPSCLPSSAKDRFSNDFEYLFFFSKNPDYYFEQQFEPFKTINVEYERNKKSKWGSRSKNTCKPNADKYRGENAENTHCYGLYGRNKRTVWSINPASSKEAHFAVFPEKLIETPILAGCPEYVCEKCGELKRKLYSTNNPEGILGFKGIPNAKTPLGGFFELEVYTENEKRLKQGHNPTVYSSAEFQGYSQCSCNSKFIPGIVLDPFMGSGTTGIMAKKLLRNFIGIELNPSYVEMARNRISRFIKYNYLPMRKLFED